MDWETTPSRCGKAESNTYQNVSKVPRSLSLYRERIVAVDLHALGDVSKDAVSAAVYTMVIQGVGIVKGCSPQSQNWQTEE